MHILDMLVGLLSVLLSFHKSNSKSSWHTTCERNTSTK